MSVWQWPLNHCSLDLTESSRIPQAKSIVGNSPVI
jgi:hypothetical protein